jgi:hypothetical protein
MGIHESINNSVCYFGPSLDQREIDEFCSTWAEYEDLPLENLLQIVGVAGYILLSVAPSEESLFYSPNERLIRRPSIE